MYRAERVFVGRGLQLDDIVKMVQTATSEKLHLVASMFEIDVQQDTEPSFFNRPTKFYSSPLALRCS